MIDLETMVAGPSFRPKQWQVSAPLPVFGNKPPVSPSPDLTRILELPRRPPPDAGQYAALVAHATARYTRHNPACRCREITEKRGAPPRSCITTPRPAQAWALWEMEQVGGLIGLIVVGGGKCVDASTEFFDYATGRRRTVAEAALAVEVATMAEARLSTKGALVVPSGAKECRQIVLADGSKIIASDDHPLWTSRGWVHARDLIIDDLVAVAAMMPEPQTVTQASDEEVAYLGYMLSDGGCSQNQLGFTNMTPEVIEDWSRCVRALGYGISERPSGSRARQFYVLKGRRRSGDGVGHYVHVVDELRERWGLRGLAKDKRAHPDLWGLPRRQIALFVNRFWACDGHVSAKGVELTLASEQLLDDLRFMLLRLGVRSRKLYTPKKLNGVLFPAWRLSCNGQNALDFLREVGDVLGKESACHQLQSTLEGLKRNANLDVVPVGWDEFHEICSEMCWPGKANWDARGKRMRGRARKFLHPTQGQLISRARFAAFCSEFKYTGKYAHYASPDIAWERVRSNEAAGVRPVYDLTVPDTHNFVANGIIVHNTMLNILSPLAVKDCRVAMLLVPPQLAGQMVLDYQLVREHFRVPNMLVHGKHEWSSGDYNPPLLHVYPYSLLSRKEATVIIESLAPDLIIADEAHALKRHETARTSRVLRYFEGHGSTTRFCAWTGSITDTSITNYAHHAALALRWGSPLPLDPVVVDDWARALDPSDWPAPAGALLDLCEPGEHVEEGFQRRLIETPGVVRFEFASVDAQLTIEERIPPPPPPIIEQALEHVEDYWQRPETSPGAGDEEELIDALSVAKVAREISCGYMHYWAFPLIEGVPQRKEDIDAWFEARKAWHKELRQKLKAREEHLDSEQLCQHAAERYWGDRPQNKGADGHPLPIWQADHWPRWRDTRNTVKYETRVRRIDDYLARDAARWALETRGVCWYESPAFGAWVSELSGLPMHGGGPDAGELIGREKGDRSIMASMKAHGTGRDGLQRIFSAQLIAQPVASSSVAEQLLGRLHRDGQQAPVVRTWIYRHTKALRDAVDKAMLRAQYVERTTGAPQKLRIGWKVDP